MQTSSSPFSALLARDRFCTNVVSCNDQELVICCSDLFIIFAGFIILYCLER